MQTLKCFNSKGKICYDLRPVLLTENTKKQHSCCVSTILLVNPVWWYL